MSEDPTPYSARRKPLTADEKTVAQNAAAVVKSGEAKYVLLRIKDGMVRAEPLDIPMDMQPQTGKR